MTEADVKALVAITDIHPFILQTSIAGDAARDEPFQIIGSALNFNDCATAIWAAEHGYTISKGHIEQINKHDDTLFRSLPFIQACARNNRIFREDFPEILAQLGDVDILEWVYAYIERPGGWCHPQKVLDAAIKTRNVPMIKFICAKFF